MVEGEKGGFVTKGSWGERRVLEVANTLYKVIMDMLIDLFGKK